MRLPRPASRETASLSSTGHSPGPRLSLARRTGTAVRAECAGCPRRPRDGLADTGGAAMRVGLAAMATVADRGAMGSMRKLRRSADAGARRGPISDSPGCRKRGTRSVPGSRPLSASAAAVSARPAYGRTRVRGAARTAQSGNCAAVDMDGNRMAERPADRGGRQAGGTCPRARRGGRRPARKGRPRAGGTCSGVTPKPHTTRWRVRPLSPPPGRGTGARTRGTAPRRPRCRTSRGRPPSPAR